MPLLTRVQTRNYRSLADVAIELGGVTVLFGPNGSGKSAFLDTLWFLRDCAVNGVDVAAERRSHGIGLLWDGADEREPIRVTITTANAEYAVEVFLASGKIDPRAGENLRSLPTQELRFVRTPGLDRVTFYLPEADSATKEVRLREPNKLSLGRYLVDVPGATEVDGVERLLRATRWHHSRSFQWWPLKRRGSEAGSSTTLDEDGRNLWSVLRNLSGRRSVDERYDTILEHMREGFPEFRDLVFEPAGTSGIYCSVVEAHRRAPVAASGMSDGHLQFLLLLTALFGGDRRDTLLLLDEPEISLHPWPIAVFGRAVRQAIERGRQVMIATHSPVLLSQFEPAEIVSTALVDGRTHLRRVSEMDEIRDLLDQYAVGSLYMAEAIAPQSAGSSGRG